MGMNPSNSMPAHLRTANQQQQQQMISRMQHSMPGSMSPELSLGMGRQPNAGVPSNASRPPNSNQLMNSLSQPSGQNHPGGGQQSTLPQNGFQPHHHHAQPSLTSSPHPGPHNPGNMMMGTPGSSQGSTPRVGGVANHDLFMNIQNNQFPPNMGRNSTRIPAGSNQFPFPASGSQSDPMDIPPMMGDGPSNPSMTGMRNAPFQPTPAQQYEDMQRDGAASFMTGAGNVPPRPPSHPNSMYGNPMASRQPQQHSPHQPEQMAGHVQHQPQRPQSQPQGPPGRPSSQAGPSHTPRSSQPSLPSSGLLPPARITPHTQPQPLPHPQRQSTPGQQVITSRPPQPSSSAPPVNGPPPSSDMPTPQSVPITRQPVMAVPVGLGQGLVRLLQFSGILAGDDVNKLRLSYWDSLIQEYFTAKAIMKLTLWKDNLKTEAKPFEIGVPILPRFFLVTTQSGVKSMSLSLDGARERLVNPSHAIIECVTAIWTYRYNSGYTVTLRGPLTVHVLIVPPIGNGQANQPASLKFDNFEFNGNTHEKTISLEAIMGQRIMDSPKTPRLHNGPTPSPNGTSTIQQRADEDRQWDEPRILIQDASIPGEPVNAFGIPQATMRCLELAESVGQMTDLIAFATETKLGPIDALAKLAEKIRDGPHNPIQGGPGFMGGPPGNGPGSFRNFHGMNGMSTSPAVTLYSGMSSANPPSHPGPNTDSPKNSSSSAEAQKQIKPPLVSQGPVPTPQPSSASTPSQTAPSSTPSLTSATLKRKPETNSPTTANSEQPPNKRLTRKRGRTAGG
ncbi:LIM-domain binding protein-domain-containing protein [Hygrophoropsis aurantiaca]|uniref:LIM-domain binding protein-domain-containing protein n=1 Tax=Hygrophoropsis aurantiaca TaxID=72124 RepID=A0ACB8AGI8_9AGAM|nr:LIM-domain binding protein-domain-containing protein [Hygrophoropsis aurantiaca]